MLVADRADARIDRMCNLNARTNDDGRAGRARLDGNSVEGALAMQKPAANNALEVGAAREAGDEGGL